MPHAPEKPCTLSSLLPAKTFIGTSSILRYGGRFLYGVRPPRREGSLVVIELTGIGGGLEVDDESVTEALLREVREEIGCSVRLVPCAETVVVHGPERTERTHLQGKELPAAVVLRGHRTPPQQPWHRESQGTSCIVVYLGEVEGRPRPSRELSAVIWLHPAHVVNTAREDVPLMTLLESGAELVEAKPGSLPRTGWVRLTDSQEALVLALRDDAFFYYERMLNG